MLELVYKNTILKSIHNTVTADFYDVMLELVYKNTILKSIHNTQDRTVKKQVVGISL